MKMPHRRKRQGQINEFRELALERVLLLFDQAEMIFAKNFELADRYVRSAWRLKTRYNLRLSRNISLKFCRKCLCYWKPGVTCRVRVKSKTVIITCLRCGYVKRLPYRSKEGSEGSTDCLGKALILPATKK
ncbi:MAG: ribonuclease P protein component 4 [Candidatus Hadarchaeaceae archaeon]